MGARIEAVCTSRSGKGLLRKGSIHLAVQAAKGCLKKANRDPNELDLIINTGIYRDDNIGEPAISALIQRQIGANLGYPPDGETSTFNFDLMNSGCGFLTAMQLIDGYLESELIKLGIVVTSDADPDPKFTQGFDFSNAGAAVLLSAGGADEGLTGFHSMTFPEHSDMLRSHVLWDKASKRNILVIKQKKAYMSRCVDCAQKALEGYISATGIDIKDIDLILPSQSPPGFAKKFRVRMGIRKSRLVDVSEDLGNIHTAGPATALERAMDNGGFDRARNILFVTVGAGITVSMAMYKRPEVVTEAVEDDEMAGIFEDESED